MFERASHLILKLLAVALLFPSRAWADGGQPAPVTNYTSAAAYSTNLLSTNNGGRIAFLTPEEEAKTFVIEDGYRLELVLGDPIIREPVLTVFDGNGRMFVAEMRSYMQNADGKDQGKRNSRVSVHWSSKHNGIYDQHAVFADHLLLPRMVLPMEDGVIINETDSDDYYIYRDSKGDGVADSKTLFHAGGKRGGNMEHQPGGMIWCMDNWIYMPMNAYRLRVRGNAVISEPTPPNMGQWGLCQDDYGKPWFINAGSESGPLNFQAHIIYGIPNVDEQREPGWEVVWPLIGLADVQGGAPRFREKEKSLNHFTSTCGDQIYRGDRLPHDLLGDLLYAEPVGRLIRRDKILHVEGLNRLHSVYTNSEFIRSTDPNFRPVNIANAPDGSLYITDMYRGVIQEKNWVTKDTYLRTVVEKYHLDENVSRGRIWRLVHDAFRPDAEPHLVGAATPLLVQTLEHPSGWWRDTAQRLLVLRGDKSCTNALRTMAQTHTNHLARIHALWTLEGLDLLDTDLIREKLADENPSVSIAAIRLSEAVYNSGDRSLVPELVKLAASKNPDVQVQALLTASLLHWPGAQRLIDLTVLSSRQLGVKKIGAHLMPPMPTNTTGTGAEGKLTVGGFSRFSAMERKHLAAGEMVYNQLCFSCHGMDGKGTPFQGAAAGMTLAPPFSGSALVNSFPDNVVSVILKGLAGPVEGRKYDSQMPALESNDDEWIASVASYIRNSFGNQSGFISDKDVARVRLSIKNRSEPWTLQELAAGNPRLLTNRSLWKLTASHNGDSLHLAIDGDAATAYDTGASQDPGMFVQIEMPEPTEICGVQMDAGTSTREYPRSYKVQVSNDGQAWSAPLIEGSSPSVFHQLFFQPVITRFVRITQTGLDPVRHWSIHELNLFGKPVAGKQESAAL